MDPYCKQHGCYAFKDGPERAACEGNCRLEHTPREAHAMDYIRDGVIEGGLWGRMEKARKEELRKKKEAADKFLDEALGESYDFKRYQQEPAPITNPCPRCGSECVEDVRHRWACTNMECKWRRG